MELASLIFPGFLALLAYTILKCIKSYYSGDDDVSKLQGPPSHSWLYGNTSELMLEIPAGRSMLEWFEKYGGVFKFQGCFGESKLIISDPVAIRHILANPATFPKTPSHQFLNLILFSSGSLLYVQGDDHHRLRSIVNPMFSSANVRSLKPVFRQYAQEFCDAMSKNLGSPIDVYQPIHITTVRMITEALMGHDAMSGGVYNAAYNSLVTSIAQRSKAAILSADIFSRLPTFVIQLLSNYPPASMKKFLHHRLTAQSISQQLLQQQYDNSRNDIEGDSSLFNVMVDANNKADKKMSDEELHSQFATLTVAGDDNTANTMLWALYELARQPDWQTRIRTEIGEAFARGVPGEEDYDKLPSLNAFIKEILRFYTTIPITERYVGTDTVLPASGGIVTAFGATLSEIKVDKGRTIVISISAYNRIPSIWGPNAGDFDPSRWFNETSIAAGPSIGPYANLLSFLGGPRVCVGWRFAILEMQVILAEIIKTFSFTLDEDASVRLAMAISLVPIDKTGNTSLPLIFERVDEQ